MMGKVEEAHQDRTRQQAGDDLRVAGSLLSWELGEAESQCIL